MLFGFKSILICYLVACGSLNTNPPSKPNWCILEYDERSVPTPPVHPDVDIGFHYFSYLVTPLKLKLTGVIKLCLRFQSEFVLIDLEMNKGAVLN